MKLAIKEAESLGGRPLAQLPPQNPDTGQIRRIKLVTDNGGALKGAAFARFIASRPSCRTSAPAPRAPARTAYTSAPSAR
ncbi:hypothetical protein ACFYXH_41655 [Streptomyces sp. NPDC002730]|uniref:hypothetical protein n=1 Tax=Streptomyces sp. NPDC002730 TaxID=3364662 RepID=UPI00368C84D8